jgi:hypothetical protein
MTTLALVVALTAGADSLESIKINEPGDLEACYAMQPYVLRRDGQAASSYHDINEVEIANGCTAKAVALAKAHPNDKAMLMQIAEEVRRGHREEASLKVFRVLAENDKSKASCDESALFNAILAGLRHPAEWPSRADADVSNALAVVDACLASSQFTTDIKDELVHAYPYVNENLCPFLKKKKVVASCEKK